VFGTFEQAEFGNFETNPEPEVVKAQDDGFGDFGDFDS
jgi:hypothetical protein